MITAEDITDRVFQESRERGIRGFIKGWKNFDINGVDVRIRQFKGRYIVEINLGFHVIVVIVQLPAELPTWSYSYECPPSDTALMELALRWDGLVC